VAGDSGVTGPTLVERLRAIAQKEPPLGRAAVTARALEAADALDALAAEPGLAGRLASSLESMPEAVAAYKGLATARGPLIDALRARDGA
jgi:hypothetical protein